MTKNWSYNAVCTVFYTSFKFSRAFTRLVHFHTQTLKTEINFLTSLEYNAHDNLSVSTVLR